MTTSPLVSPRPVELGRSVEDPAPAPDAIARPNVTPAANVDTGDRSRAVETRFETTWSALTLFLHGELDMSTQPRLALAGADLIARAVSARDRAAAAENDITLSDASRPTTAVIDAAGLQFIDAAGLSALVTLHNTLGRADIRLSTIHPSRQLRRISAICQLDTILGVEPTDPVR